MVPGFVYGLSGTEFQVFRAKGLDFLAYVVHTRGMTTTEILTPQIGDTTGIRTARRTYQSGQIISLDFVANTGVFRTPAGRKIEFPLTGVEYMRGDMLTGYRVFTYGKVL